MRTVTSGAQGRRGWVAAVLVVLATTSLAGPAASDGRRALGRRTLERRAAADAGARNPVPGEILVRYRSDAARSARAAARRRAGSGSRRALRVRNWELLRVAPEDADEALARLRRDPAVSTAAPNERAYPTATPDDTFFPLQWGMHNTGQEPFAGTPDADVDAPAAWSETTGTDDVVVAIVDTGVAYDHPDLEPNMWTNSGEIGGGKESNGVDDDGNGYEDDWRGYDWVDADNDPYDEDGHGTHVAGIVGAAGDDGYGIAGTAWTVDLMPLRVLGPDGGTMADIADAFGYAAENGAAIVNASLGGSSDPGGIIADAVRDADDTLFVVAAGNSASNNDSSPVYPCNISASNLICVAATDQTDGLASFSNRGASSVDLAAPGASIASTYLPSVAASAGSASLADSPGAYANNADAWIRTVASIDLSAGTNCALEYSMRLDTAGSGDTLMVERSVDGVNWTSIEGDGWYGSTGGDFDEFTADLSADGEATVWIRFRLVSDASDTDDGAFLDDLAVVCDDGTVWTEGFEGDIEATWVSGGTEDQWASADVAGEWAYLDGTSMATPAVAGGASLLWAERPSSSVGHVRNVLLGSTDRRSSLSGKVLTDGRLNLDRALDCLGDVADPSGQRLTADALARRYQRSRSFGISWTGGGDDGCGFRSYDVRYSRAPHDGDFRSARVWAFDTTATRKSFTASSGTYCFRVRSRDRAWNASSWSARDCTAVPVNDRSLAASPSWIRFRSDAGYYLDTYSYSSERGATLKLRGVEYKRLALIATRCVGCGRVAVYRGSRLIERIDLDSSRFRRRRFISIASHESVRGPATITIRVLSDGKPVRIEGLAVSRV